MKDYAQHHDAHVRLTILRLLAGAAEYSANDSVLVAAVRGMGLACTRDQLRGHLSWLAEQRMLTLLHPSETLAVATITERGGDVAAGRSSVQGIARPSPGS
jgi:hypothetical protein